MTTIVSSIVAGGLLAGLAVAQPAPRYIVKDLGTLGGNTSFGLQLNDLGWVAGSANLTTNGPQHAFLWFGGVHLVDLGTLGGPNSAADGPNVLGQAAVSAETSVNFGPTGEDFCAFGTHHQCLGAVWKNGALKALPTLVNSATTNTNAFGLNNLGQVVGFAENGIVGDATDPADCKIGGTPFQKFQFEAVRWEPNGQIRELSPLKGDTVGFAFGINDFGQAIGASGTCSNTALPPNPAGAHAVLWEADGTPVNLGSLGGPYNVASSINDLGEVVGGSLSPGDGVIHAFKWTRATGMQDYGAFPGAFLTVPPCCGSINNRGEMVGFAIDAATGNLRALIWQGKKPMDLNNFIPKGSGWYLQAAYSVNDRGEITGQGLIGGNVHAFLAIPSTGGFGEQEFAPAGREENGVVPGVMRPGRFGFPHVRLR